MNVKRGKELHKIFWYKHTLKIYRWHWLQLSCLPTILIPLYGQLEAGFNWLKIFLVAYWGNMLTFKKLFFFSPCILRDLSPHQDHFTTQYSLTFALRRYYHSEHHGWSNRLLLQFTNLSCNSLQTCKVFKNPCLLTVICPLIYSWKFNHV